MIATPSVAVPPIRFDLQPMLDWQASYVEGVLQLQNAQLQILVAWQRSFAAAGQELQDQWVARYGGGVPLDG